MATVIALLMALTIFLYVENKPVPQVQVVPPPSQENKDVLEEPAVKEIEPPVEVATSSPTTLGMKTWVWTKALYNDGHEVVPPEGVFSLTFLDDGSFTTTTDCNSVGGTYGVNNTELTFPEIRSTKMFCEQSKEVVFVTLLRDTSSYHFTSGGELILDLKFDSGSVVFK